MFGARSVQQYAKTLMAPQHLVCHMHYIYTHTASKCFFLQYHQDYPYAGPLLDANWLCRECHQTVIKHPRAAQSGHLSLLIPLLAALSCRCCCSPFSLSSSPCVCVYLTNIKIFIYIFFYNIGFFSQTTKKGLETYPSIF